MEFWVLGRRHIVNYKCARKHIVISIGDPNDPDPVSLPVNSNRIDTLYLRFHDWDQRGKELFEKDESLFPSAVLFDAGMAQRILEFVISYKGKFDLIICQCEAGISRSAGTAAALSRLMNGEDEYFFKRFLPNRLVYRTILDVAYFTDLRYDNKT